MRAFVEAASLDVEGDMVAVANTANLGDNSSTLEAYHLFYGEVSRFACILQKESLDDWRTATLCCRDTIPELRVCPSNPWPCDPWFIVAYMRWKSLQAGEQIPHPKNPAEFVRDINGKVILAVGHWSSCNGVEKAMSSLSRLHSLYNGKGCCASNEVYVEPCKECVKRNGGFIGIREKEQRTICTWNSCSTHSGSPQLKYKGNAMKCDMAKAAVHNLKEELSSTHMRKGNVRLLPGHVRDIGRYCFTRATNNKDKKNGVWHLMVYTMVLVGLQLFLRAAELLGMRTSDFRTNAFMVRRSGVQSLAVRIKGKTDKRGIYLNLWRNDEFPEFCAVRHLLLLIALVGLDCEDGVLFMSKEELLKIVSGKKKQ